MRAGLGWVAFCLFGGCGRSEVVEPGVSPAATAARAESSAETPSTTAALGPSVSVPSGSPVPTPELAGRTPCAVGPVHQLQAVPAAQGAVSLRLGYGYGGGLAVWQTEDHHVWTQLLDRRGQPIGTPVQAGSPRNVLFKRVLAVSDGYLIVAEDFSDFDLNNWFVWKADATGKLTGKLSLDAGLHTFHAVSPVVDDRVLFFLANDRLENQTTSRVLLLSSGERLEQQHFDFPVATPTYHAPAVELALGSRDWAVWVQNPEPAGQVLLRPGGVVKANFPPRPTTLFTDYHTVAMRFDGAVLQLLTSPRDSRSEVVVFESLEGERALVGEQPGRTALNVGEVKPDGTVGLTTSFDFEPSSELPQPFANQLTLDLGTKRAQRSTLIGLHPVGEPMSLEGLVPPISDGLYASSAWSRERWVVAYWSSAGQGGTVNAFALDCAAHGGKKGVGAAGAMTAE